MRDERRNPLGAGPLFVYGGVGMAALTAELMPPGVRAARVENSAAAMKKAARGGL